MYVDFDRKGYKSEYSEYETDYIFDRNIYIDFAEEDSYLAFCDFGRDETRILEVLVFKIEVEDFKTYFVGQQSIWVLAG